MALSTTESRMKIAIAILTNVRENYPEITTSIAQVWGLTTTRGLYRIGLHRPSAPTYSLVPRGNLVIPAGTVLDGLNSWQVAAIPHVFDRFDVYQEANTAAYNPLDPVPPTSGSTAEPLHIEQVAMLVIFGLVHLNRHARLNMAEMYNDVMARFFAGEARTPPTTTPPTIVPHDEVSLTGTYANNLNAATGEPVVMDTAHLDGNQDPNVLAAAEILMSFKDR